MRMALAIAAIAIGPCVTSDAARGQNMPALEHVDPGIEEPSPPLTLDVAYTADIVSNAAGGLRRGTVYLDNFDAVLDADLDPLVGWRGAKARAYALYNNGASINALVGDAQSVNNIEAGSQALRLYEAWVEQEIGRRASLLVGLYDLNSEFDALEASSLFVGSAHGIGTDFSQSGQNGPSIFPVTSLTARLEVEPGDGWAVRAAVLDAVPGDPARPHRTTIRLDRGDGALIVGEVEAPVAGGRLLLGHWRYTAPFEALDGKRGRGNLGFYLRGEAPLVSAARRTVHGFFRLGTASGRYNLFDRFASGGLTFTGWVPGRINDEFGIGVAAAFTGERQRRLSGAARSEIAIEATYRAGLTPWLTVQPHAQYVVQPSADPRIRDAFVVGIRTEFAFRLFGS